MNSVWKEEGRKAAKDGKKETDCPYKEGTYGFAQWIAGFKEVYNVKK